MFQQFNSYPTYQPFGKDWTVAQLEAQHKVYGNDYPIDGDAMTIALNTFLNR